MSSFESAILKQRKEKCAHLLRGCGARKLRGMACSGIAIASVTCYDRQPALICAGLVVVYSAMIHCEPNASDQTFVNVLLVVWRQWQITILLVVGMALQLLLVVAGFFRKRALSRTFHVVVWVAFLGVEAASVYALGLMLGSGCDHVFSLWAPLVLFHMGAADGINAYAPADNELWRRSTFKMLLSVLAAAFILRRGDFCHRYLAAGVVLSVVGIFKYVERVYALFRGSTAQILVSARPIYHFMARTTWNENEKNALLVAGEWDWYTQYKSKRSAPDQNATWVYYSDITELEDFINSPMKDDIHDLCLAYALFKIYRRRLTNLRMHFRAADYEKVRGILFSIGDSKRIINVIDLEMSLIFDCVFTKAAGNRLFQGIGMVTRLLSAVLLLVALVDLASVRAMNVGCRSSTDYRIHIAGASGPVEGLTFLFVVVALVVECLQIYRHVRCNSFRVWLAYTYITEKRCIDANRNRPHLQGAALTRMSMVIHRFNMKVIFALLQCSSMRWPGESTTHWRYNIGQRSIVADAMESMFWHFFIAFQINPMKSLRKKKQKIEGLLTVDVGELQHYLIEELIAIGEGFKQQPDKLRKQVAKTVRNPIKDGKMIFTSLEEVVLHCHLVTSVCEMQLLSDKDLDKAEGRYFRKHKKMSIWLSRYCLYLMLRRPKLMPEDPDLAASLYSRLREYLKDEIYLKHPINDTEDASEITEEDALLQETKKSQTAGPQQLDKGPAAADLAMCRAYTLLHKSDIERWETLAGIWVDIVIHIAAAEQNATPHTEQMAKGGELLTLLWVVIGHMGMDQNA